MSDVATPPAGRPGYAMGVGLTALGGFLLTFDALLLRMVQAERWSLVFVRGVFMFGAGVVAWLLLRRRVESARSFFNGPAGLLVALLYGTNSVCFVLALSHTKVANVLFLASTAPLFAALLSVVVLKERIHPATWAAMLSALLGILLVVGDAMARGSWLGDAFALAGAASLGAAFVATRRSGRNMFMAPAVGGLVAAVVAAPLVRGVSFTPAEWGYVGLEAGLLIPVALGLIAVGPKYLPAPQVGLFLLLQTVLGPAWVWLFLGEAPSTFSAVGGALIVGTLVLNSAYFLLRKSPPDAARAR